MKGWNWLLSQDTYCRRNSNSKMRNSATEYHYNNSFGCVVGNNQTTTESSSSGEEESLSDFNQLNKEVLNSPSSFDDEDDDEQEQRRTKFQKKSDCHLNHGNSTIVEEEPTLGMMSLFTLMGMGSLLAYNTMVTAIDWFQLNYPAIKNKIAADVATYMLSSLLATTVLLLPFTLEPKRSLPSSESRSATFLTENTSQRNSNITVEGADGKYIPTSILDDENCYPNEGMQQGSDKGLNGCYSCWFDTSIMFQRFYMMLKTILCQPTKRVAIGFLIEVILMWILASWETPPYWIIRCLSIAVGGGDAISSSGLYVYAASFHVRYTACVAFGSAIAGWFVSVLRWMTIQWAYKQQNVVEGDILLNDDDAAVVSTAEWHSTRLFFLLSALILFGCYLSLLVTIQYTKKAAAGRMASNTTPTSSDYAKIGNNDTTTGTTEHDGCLEVELVSEERGDNDRIREGLFSTSDGDNSDEESKSRICIDTSNTSNVVLEPQQQEDDDEFMICSESHLLRKKPSDASSSSYGSHHSFNKTIAPPAPSSDQPSKLKQTYVEPLDSPSSLAVTPTLCDNVYNNPHTGVLQVKDVIEKELRSHLPQSCQVREVPIHNHTEALADEISPQSNFTSQNQMNPIVIADRVFNTVRCRLHQLQEMVQRISITYLPEEVMLYLNTLKVIWQPALMGFLNFFITLALFPGIVTLIHSSRWQISNINEYYDAEAKQQQQDASMDAMPNNYNYNGEFFNQTINGTSVISSGINTSNTTMTTSSSVSSVVADQFPLLLIFLFNVWDCIGRAILTLPWMVNLLIPSSRRNYNTVTCPTDTISHKRFLFISTSNIHRSFLIMVTIPTLLRFIFFPLLTRSVIHCATNADSSSLTQPNESNTDRFLVTADDVQVIDRNTNTLVSQTVLPFQDIWNCILISIFGFTNGYVFGACFMVGPIMVLTEANYNRGVSIRNVPENNYDDSLEEEGVTKTNGGRRSAITAVKEEKKKDAASLVLLLTSYIGLALGGMFGVHIVQTLFPSSFL